MYVCVCVCVCVCMCIHVLYVYIQVVKHVSCDTDRELSEEGR